MVSLYKNLEISNFTSLGGSCKVLKELEINNKPIHYTTIQKFASNMSNF